MRDVAGICAVVPSKQPGFRPVVHGMGVVIAPRIVITCAHVVETALGPHWLTDESAPTIRVSFPFADGAFREGTVSRDLYFPADRNDPKSVSDIAVIALVEDVPPEVGIATLAAAEVDLAVKAYGFRGELRPDGTWISHPDGQWASGMIIGPQPGGRGQLEGIRTTGTRVERGFSGSGVFAPASQTLVGMIVESDRDVTTRVAQYIDGAALRAVLGRPESLEPFAEAQAKISKLKKTALARRKARQALQFETIRFVGRKDAELLFLSHLTDSMLPIHFVGHGGMGKTTLLRRCAFLAEEQGFETIYIDLAFVQGRVDLVRKVVVALMTTTLYEFDAYVAAVRRYTAIEDRLLNNPGLDVGTIYSLSKLRELMPVEDGEAEDVRGSSAREAESLNSAATFAILAALSAEDREFFRDPLAELLGALAADIGGKRLMLEFDRTERLPRRIGEWITGEFARRLDGIMVLTAGRDDISIEWRRAAGDIRIYEVGRLSDEECLELLLSAGIPRGLGERVAESTRGIPLALALAAEMAGNLDERTLDDVMDSYVVDRMIAVFLEEMSDKQKRALQRLAVFRRFNRESALELEICDHQTIDDMLGRRFVKHVPLGYAVHDRVRDFILRDLRRQEPRTYQQWHEQAAAYYESSGAPQGRGDASFLEIMYHRLSAHPAEGFEQLRKHFTSAALAIEPDFSEAMVTVAHESNLDSSLPLLWLRFFEGAVMRQRFDFSAANEIYEEILADPTLEHQQELKGELLYQRSTALWYLCRFEESQRVAEESVELNKSLQKPLFVNRSLGIVGLALDRMGQFENAIKVIRQMERAAGKTDPYSRGYALNSIGYFSWHAGNWRRTESALTDCLQLWRSLGNPVGECYPLGHLGLLFCVTGRRDQAEQMLTNGRRLSEISGNSEMVAKTVQNLSRFEVEYGDPAIGLELARESLEVCIALKHPYFGADSHRLIAEACVATGDLAAARQAIAEGIEMLPSVSAAYLDLRLRIAGANIDILMATAQGYPPSTALKEHMAALTGTAAARSFPNLVAEAELGRLRLLSMERSSRGSDVFESGAQAAFAYNWYCGMTFLEKAGEVLLPDDLELAKVSYGAERLRELHRSRYTLRAEPEIDNERIRTYLAGLPH